MFVGLLGQNWMSQKPYICRNLPKKHDFHKFNNINTVFSCFCFISATASCNFSKKCVCAFVKTHLTSALKTHIFDEYVRFKCLLLGVNLLFPKLQKVKSPCPTVSKTRKNTQKRLKNKFLYFF